MVRAKTIAKVIAICSISGGMFLVQPMAAKAKQWDADRYAKCLKRDGQSGLDLVENIHSDACRKGRMAIEDSDYPVGYFDVAASVAASRDKKNGGEWALFAKFRVATTATRFYGPSSILNEPPKVVTRFSTVSTILGGELYELDISSQKAAFPDCNRFARRGMAMSKCDLVNGVVVHLNKDVIEKITSDASAQPLGSQKFKLFTDELKGITIKIPYAEILAVAKTAQ